MILSTTESLWFETRLGLAEQLEAAGMDVLTPAAFEPGRFKQAALDEIRPDNSQGEYYITDVPGVLLGQKKPVRALQVLKASEVLSINTVEELAIVEAAMQEAGKAE